MSLLTPMYHSIAREQTTDLFALHEQRFAEHLRGLNTTKHQAVTLKRIARWLDGDETLPHRAVLVTFDDGYLDNLEVALPWLQKHGLTACIFIATDWCGTTKRQYSKPETRDCPMLTWAEVRQLADMGVEIAAHSRSHPFLTRLSEDDVWTEIYGSKCELEDHLGKEILAFSYPNSNHNQKIREMVQRAGYGMAFGGRSGLSGRKTDRYDLYRPCIYNGCSVAEFVVSICTGFDLRTRYWDVRRRLRRVETNTFVGTDR